MHGDKRMVLCGHSEMVIACMQMDQWRPCLL